MKLFFSSKLALCFTMLIVVQMMLRRALSKPTQILYSFAIFSDGVVNANKRTLNPTQRRQGGRATGR